MHAISPAHPLFSPVRLDAVLAVRAYPLVRLFEPGQSLSAWVRFVRARARTPNAGVTAVEDARGYYHALIVWNVDTHLSWRRTLRIETHMLGDLPGGGLHATVLTIVRELAQEKHCDTILLEPADVPGSLARTALISKGFRPLTRQAWLAPAEP
jgi:hypothetical protein